MEEAEIDADYIDMGSLSSAITSIRQKKPPTSPRLTQSTQVAASLFDYQYDKETASDDVKTEPEETSIYQLPKANPMLSPLSQHVDGPLVPPKAAKRTKLSKPVAHQPQQSPSSVQKQEDVTNTVHSSPDGNANKLTQSNESDRADGLFNPDDKKLFTLTKQQRPSTYQPLKINSLPSPRPYQPLDSFLPPRNIVRQKANKAALLSPTSPGKADEVTVTTPVKETIQSPTGSDIPNELAQSNETSDSFTADDDDDDDKKSSDKTEQQESSAYQELRINPVPSNYQPVDPLIPPKNIIRSSKPNNLVLHHPLSPDKDKILQDKTIQDKTSVLLTPPRSLNPYSVDPSRNVGSSSFKEQRGGNSTLEVEEEKPGEQSFTLEDFVEIYPLPQLVSVTEGHYGDTDDFSMSEGMEFIVFFKKKTQAVTATARHTDKAYYIPINCSLQFSPYQRDSREHLTKSYYYKTVGQLVQRKYGLPKVVKVLKGRKTAPVLNANELLFPKGLSSRGTHLKFTDIRKEEIQLKLSCDIGFSTNPSDTKMNLADYVENFNEFPSSVMVFCNLETSRTMFEIHTGMEMVLREYKTLYSCICSTDVHGEWKYPLIELPAALPIEIKAIESPTVALDPIYDTAKKLYETFDLSMIQTSMYLAQDDEHDYTEISNTYQTLTRSSVFYNLEMPAIVYTMGRTKNPDPVKSDSSSSTTVASPPLPPRYGGPISCKLQTQSQFFQHKKQLPQDPIKDTAYIYTSIADERRFYVRSFTTAHVLKLLDKMDLGHFKGIFQQNNIDGKMLLLLTKYELEEMGIKDCVSQKRLLDVISGHTAYKVK